MGTQNPLKLNSISKLLVAGVIGISLLPQPGKSLPATKGLVPKETPTGRTRILVLVDRSGSVHYDAKKMSQRLFEDLAKIKKTGDELGIAFIHAQTLTNPKRSRIAADLPDNYDDQGGATQQRMRMAQEDAVREQRRQMREDIKQALAVGSNSAVGQSTDVWGSLSTITTFFQGATANDRCIVYYISDMVESMPGTGRHDFEAKHPLEDASALQALAKADIPQIRKRYGITESEPLKVIDNVIVLFPTSGMARSQNNAMSRYWSAIFTRLGLSPNNLLFE